ncbi:MAG: tetratricopeptide repeat protein [Acidobacteriota bacterium]
MLVLRPTSRWLLAAAVFAAACRTAAPPSLERVPDPTLPPVGGTALSPDEQGAARTAVAAAERADWAAAARALARLPAGHPMTRLASMEVRFLRGEDVAADAITLAREVGGYGSAWAFAYLTARQAGRQADALEAARHANALQPGAQWPPLIGELERTMAESQLADARAQLARGDARGALERATAMLESDPASVPVRMLAVQAALAAGRSGEAASLVTALPDTPEGLAIKGRVAESLGQWDIAAEEYHRLPARFPNRCELLLGARERARLVNAPPYLTRALAAPTLNRRGLAALLVWEVPTLRDQARNPVTVFEDVVQAAERTDIVIVTRAGVMLGDTLARRFAPDRAVTARELRAVVERLAAVMGRPAPHWCGEAAGPSCLTLPAEIDGKGAAGLIRRVAGDGEETCTQR